MSVSFPGPVLYEQLDLILSNFLIREIGVFYHMLFLAAALFCSGAKSLFRTVQKLC